MTELVSKVGDVLHEPISTDDIEVCHRVPTREEGKSNVVVLFKNRQKRDAVLEKARKARIRNNDLGLPGQTQIFINEHLCPALKRLLFQAVTKKRECEWRYVWTRNGTIFARKSESSDRVRIESYRDLSKIA